MKDRLIALTGTCIGCGVPNGLYQPQHEVIYCPDCAKKNDDWDLAMMHLGSLLGPVVTAWYRHWRARGFPAQSLINLVDNSDELVDIIHVLKASEIPKSKAAVIPNTLHRAARPTRQLEVAA